MNFKSYLLLILILATLSAKSQYQLKVKKEDNRFLFFKKGIKNDTIVKGKTDTFYIKLADSSQKHVVCFINNGQFIKQKDKATYTLRYIPGMKYSHTLIDTAFTTQFEGNCEANKTINIEFRNTKNQSSIIKNTFYVK